MKYIPKIVRTVFILISLIFAVLLMAAYLMQDKVSAIIISHINNRIKTRIEIESVHLSFIRSFPRASLVIRNVYVHSSPGFRKSDFGLMNSDTLLYAESASIIFKPIDAIRGNYHIETIVARKGRLNILTDSEGRINYELGSVNGPVNEEVSLNLESISLSELQTSYLNASNDVEIRGYILNGRIKTRIKGNEFDFSSKSDLELNQIKFGNTTIKHKFKAVTDVSLLHNKEGIKFNKSQILIDGNEIDIEGEITSDHYYDLSVSGNNIDLKGIKQYLPEKISEKTAPYSPSGKLSFSSGIKGLMSKIKSPHVEMVYALENGQITYPGSRYSVRNISFQGQYSNGSGNNFKTSVASFNNFNFKLGSADYEGSLIIKNFNEPISEIVLKGRLYPAELKDFFNFKNVISASGHIDTDLRMYSGYTFSKAFTSDVIIDMQPQGTLIFNNFSLHLSKPVFDIKSVNGAVNVSDIYTTSRLSFEYSGQKVDLSGDFRNVPEWLAGRNVTLYAAGDVHFDKFIPEVYSSTRKENNSVSFPADMILDLNFSLDNLHYKTLNASAVKGSLTYKPKTLTFKQIYFRSIEGIISGKGFIVQNRNNSFISRGDFQLENIDIKQAFKTFHDFGQKFIVEENISGKLSGTISVLLPFNANFTPRPAELTADGKYIISDGALINFEPVKKLSSFIELSELENIHFEKLENDFFIRNNSLVIPQMDVKSTAAELSVNGRHSFENNYEYHVRVLLSQILSKKRRSSRRSNTEFGAIKDDGLGRTSLLLKINNKGEDVKVSYDLKAVTQEINRSLNAEKEVLKTIISEEYGDKPENQEPTEKSAQKKERFRITWEETDSVPVSEKREEEKGFRDLFRKN